MRNTKTALVIGGGIAGPVAAMALRRAGIDATVCESYDSRADGVGGMLGLAPNGLAALELVGAADAVREVGDPVSSLVIQSWTGKRLAQFGDGTGPVFHAVWRADLYRALYEEAARQGVAIEHGKRLVHAQDDGDGVTATFADGTHATADILIGADGIRSTVRTLIDPAAPKPRYTGLVGMGGRPTPCDLDSTGGAMHMIYGKRTFFAYSVTDDGRAGWFANVPRRERLTSDDAITAAQWRELLLDAVADDRGPATHILANVYPADMVVVPALEHLPTVPTWSRGRMTLVGDAAHATSPSSGQGASIAIESAIELARCLRDLPVPDAFAAYEHLRRDRVERIIAAGARTSNTKCPGPVARVLRDLTMPTVMKALAKPERMAWQINHRIDWDVRVTHGSAAHVR